MLLVIADDHLALALPNGCLDLRELVLAAQGFDGLVEDGLNVLLPGAAPGLKLSPALSQRYDVANSNRSRCATLSHEE
jgi:hypothetical protein